MEQLTADSTRTGTTAGTSEDRRLDKLEPSELLLRQHANALRLIANTYGTDLGALTVAAREVLDAEGANLISKTTNDRKRGEIAALAACAGAKVSGTSDRPESPLAIAKLIEGIDEPLLRDTLYQHHWLGRELSEVAESQGLRIVTVRQNYARAIRKASVNIDGSWKSRGAGRTAANVDIKTLFAASDTLPLGAQELYVDAMAAVARSLLTTRVFYMGPRSLKVVYGKAWIEMPERLSLAEQRLMAAEDRAAYDQTKNYTVIANPEIFTIRITHVDSGDDQSDVHAWWVSGSQPVAILDADENFLGECSPDSPNFTFDFKELPSEFCLREMGTL